MRLEKKYLHEISTLRGKNNLAKSEDFYWKLASAIYKKTQKSTFAKIYR